jgi:hypothetical protein
MVSPFKVKGRTFTDRQPLSSLRVEVAGDAPAVVPEPGTMVLLVSGLLLMRTRRTSRHAV